MGGKAEEPTLTQGALLGADSATMPQTSHRNVECGATVSAGAKPLAGAGQHTRPRDFDEECLMQKRQTRRHFLASMSAAGAAAIPGAYGSLADEPPGLLPGPAAAEPPPETTTLRVHHSLSLCLAPQYVAEELLRAEGFTEVQYVTHEQSGGLYEGLTSGMADIGNDFAPMLIMHLDAGDPITILGGIHVGCFELFGTERVRSIHDLKGKRVAIGGLGQPPHVFLASMVAYVGLDPGKDINWVVHAPAEAMQLLADREIDALIAFPPGPQEIRAKQIGQMVVSSALDRPWSQYFCCMAVASREFVRTARSPPSGRCARS
jgi:NitT/TauT family transport system substrate-binding protein